MKVIKNINYLMSTGLVILSFYLNNKMVWLSFQCVEWDQKHVGYVFHCSHYPLVKCHFHTSKDTKELSKK